MPLPCRLSIITYTYNTEITFTTQHSVTTGCSELTLDEMNIYIWCGFQRNNQHLRMVICNGCTRFCIEFRWMLLFEYMRSDIMLHFRISVGVFLIFCAFHFWEKFIFYLIPAYCMPRTFNLLEFSFTIIIIIIIIIVIYTYIHNIKKHNN